MKVAVYSSKNYDIDSLKQSNHDEKIELNFLQVPLDIKTAALAVDHEAVCIFVNDVADEAVLTKLSELGVKYIALRCAGFNNVDLAAAKKLGLKVARVPAYSPESVAEFAVGMIMTVVRKYHKAYNRVREGNFLLDGLLGFNLAHKTVGIIGTGRIGLLTGQILSKGFSCNVIAYDVYPNEAAASAHGIKYVDTLEELLQTSDIISLHCPLMESTYHILDEHNLSLTKKGVVLINTSRGGLIDSTALISALKSGQVGAVGLDVYEKEAEYFFDDSSSKIIYDDNLSRLISFYNVFISGHQAFLTKEALANIADTTLGNLRELAASGTTQNSVE
ncbi:D-isomer specific 2-hydroxyacid dehydrogenase [Peziza echinospora]|nr:D-isomer specific 2-hydroxyacid dehydrogenase [Peziza echinospora]